MKGYVSKALGLDRDYHVVLRPERRGIAVRLQRERRSRARFAVEDLQAAAANGFEMRAARYDRNRVAGTREPGGDQATDCAGAVDADFHSVILSSATRRTACSDFRGTSKP